MRMLKKHMNIRISDYLIEQIDIIGKVLGMTKSEEVIQAIVEFVTYLIKEQ